MESLGGDSLWWNRFIARHGAVAYYVILIILFLLSPKIAYLSSELLEMHAVDTYKEFYESNENILKELPITREAYKYDISANNLYDIFKKISEDEFKHAKSMQNIKSLPYK
jgi:ubiquinol oxidase